MVEEKPTFLADMRTLFATVLTDPGSSLAYGVDSLVTITAAAIAVNFAHGATMTVIAGATIMVVYLIAIVLYNRMTHVHAHPRLGGGSYVAAVLASHTWRNHPRVRGAFGILSRIGASSMLSDFPATQAISLIAGVEALYFVPVENRLMVAFGFLLLLSLVQRFGLMSLGKILIWPVIAFYSVNILINGVGLASILANGWQAPKIAVTGSAQSPLFLILHAVANGATIITGVEVGYSSVNVPAHGHRVVRSSMWILYVIVFVTYTLQLVNFLGLGVTYDTNIPVPITIAHHIGGDFVAVPFGILTAVVLLLAAQTAQSDFPIELMRLARSDLFPRGLGDSSWRKVRVPLGQRFKAHGGVYNPRAVWFLGFVTVALLYFFPSSHAIEGMYGVAVVTAIAISVSSFFARLLRTRGHYFMAGLASVVFVGMLVNIVYNKFFEGAWAILIMMVGYFVIFGLSHAIYSLYRDKQSLLTMEEAVWYPAFNAVEVDAKSALLITSFHPGVILFLKEYLKSKRMPLVIHFQNAESDHLPTESPKWFRNIPVAADTDIITAIVNYVQQNSIERVHLVPLLVSGRIPFQRHFFGNTIDALRDSLSRVANLQVEYNRERVAISLGESLRRALRWDAWAGAEIARR